MNKIAITLIALLLLIVTGCSKKEVVNHNYTYKGENEFWNAAYTTNGSVTFEQKDDELDVDTESNYVLTVTYKKELSDLSSIKNIVISYETSNSSGSLSEIYSEDEAITSKTFTLSGGGSSTLNEDDIIKVTITLDGDVQSLELKSDN